jgi:hypothetical protein
MFAIYWFVISQIHPEVFLSSPAKNKNLSRIECLLDGIDAEKLEADLNELLVRENYTVTRISLLNVLQICLAYRRRNCQFT